MSMAVDEAVKLIDEAFSLALAQPLSVFVSGLVADEANNEKTLARLIIAAKHYALARNTVVKAIRAGEIVFE